MLYGNNSLNRKRDLPSSVHYSRWRSRVSGRQVRTFISRNLPMVPSNTESFSDPMAKLNRWQAVRPNRLARSFGDVWQFRDGHRILESTEFGVRPEIARRPQNSKLLS